MEKRDGTKGSLSKILIWEENKEEGKEGKYVSSGVDVLPSLRFTDPGYGLYIAICRYEPTPGARATCNFSLKAG